jgi:DNA-binding FadR family transcriptional regulator
MRATVERARLALDRVRRLLGTPRRHALTFAEHSAIAQALRKAEPEAARAAMAAHIDSVMKELEAFAVAQPDVFADSEPTAERL